MRKSTPLLMIIAFCLITIAAAGQNQQNHPPKLFRAADGKLYVNKNQPMYLFIGTSPDNNAQLERLESEHSRQYTNPFYFDLEGYNTLRTPSQVDTITKKVVYPITDIIFEVYSDGLAPVTKASFNNAPKFIKDGKTYYGMGLAVDLNASDATSGVDQTYFSINTQAFIPKKETIKFDQEKNYQLSFYSVDNVGNVENITTHNFHVDLAPPIANWSLEGDVHENRASGNSKIKIFAQDALTGVKSITYQINDQPVRAYKDGILLSSLPTGTYKLRYWVEDHVGNTFEGSDGGADVYAFIVDQTPPTTSSLIIGDQYAGKYLYVSPRSKCQINAEDDQLGINKIMYSFGSQALDKTYEGPFHFENTTGAQILYFQAWDYVANKSTVERLTVFMDNEAPITRIQYTGPQFFARDTLFINKETTIQLISEDKESGIKNISYRINNDPFQNGDQFKVVEGGLHTVRFKATDNVDNLEQEKQSEFVVDNDPPEIYVNFSIKAIREEVINNETISVYPPYVKMYIGATDKQCGTQDIFFAIDGGSKRKYTGVDSPADIELFKDEKIYEVTVEATDKLGNKSTKLVKFRVDKK